MSDSASPALKILEWGQLAALATVLVLPFAAAGELPATAEGMTTAAAATFVGLGLLRAVLAADSLSRRGLLLILPLVVVLGVCAAQLVPVPPTVLESLSPQAAAWRARLGEAVGQPLDMPTPSPVSEQARAKIPAQAQAEAEALGEPWPPPVDEASSDRVGPAPVHLAEFAGRDELGRLAVAVFVALATVLAPADRSHLRRLLIVLTVFATVTAYLMLLAKVIGPRAWFWLALPEAPEGPYDPYTNFGNRNRLAGLVNVGIGACLGLVLEALRAGQRGAGGGSHRHQTAGGSGPLPGSPEGLAGVGGGLGVYGGMSGIEAVRRLLGFPSMGIGWQSKSGSGGTGDRDAAAVSRQALILLLPALAGMMAAVVLSLSRGGVIALTIALALAVVGLLVNASTRRAAGVPAVVMLGAMLLIGWLGWEPVERRLSTLADAQQLRTSRLQLWADTIRMTADFPLTGIGLGGFASVFPMYQTAESMFAFTHAENEYLHMAAELGLAGGVPLAVALLMVLWAAGRLALAALGGQALLGGVAFAVVTILIGSVGDFGFHGPANMYLYVVVIGVCWRQSAELAAARPGDPQVAAADEGRWPAVPRVSVPPTSATLTLTRVMLVAVILVGGVVFAAVVERQLNVAAAENHVLMIAQLGRARLPDGGLSHRLAAMSLRPDDGVLHSRLGQSFVPVAANEFGPHRARADGPAFRAAERALRRSLASQPVNGSALLGLGRLYALVNSPRATALLEAARDADPTEGRARVELGRWYLRQDRPQEALTELARAAQLRPNSYLPDLEDALPGLLRFAPGRVDWAAAFDDAATASHAAKFLATRGYGSVAKVIAARAEQLSPPHRP